MSDKPARAMRGPWGRGKRYDLLRDEIESDDGRVAALVWIRRAKCPSHPGNHESGYQEDPEFLATADLVEAAPELLEVVGAMVADLEEKLVALGWESVEQYHSSVGKADPHMRAVALLKRLNAYPTAVEQTEES